jgi:hypothetical protein
VSVLAVLQFVGPQTTRLAARRRGVSGPKAFSSG